MYAAHEDLYALDHQPRDRGGYAYCLKGVCHHGKCRCCSAALLSARRDRRPSFSNTCRRWVFTVWGEMKSFSAISLLVLPSAAKSATVNSAAVSAPQPVV